MRGVGAFFSLPLPNPRPGWRISGAASRSLPLRIFFSPFLFLSFSDPPAVGRRVQSTRRSKSHSWSLGGKSTRGMLAGSSRQSTTDSKWPARCVDAAKSLDDRPVTYLIFFPHLFFFLLPAASPRLDGQGMWPLLCSRTPKNARHGICCRLCSRRGGQKLCKSRALATSLSRQAAHIQALDPPY